MRSVSKAFSLVLTHAERTTTKLISRSFAAVLIACRSHHCFIVIVFAYTLRGGTGFGAAIAMPLRSPYARLGIGRLFGYFFWHPFMQISYSVLHVFAE